MVKFTVITDQIKHALKKRTIKKYAARFSKRIGFFARGFNEKIESVPVLILGMQRSGTTIIEYVLDLCKDTWVFHERENNNIYSNFRIKDFKDMRRAMGSINANYCVFKPLADCHLISEFVTEFPNIKIIWIYRNYEDTVNSWLQKWEGVDQVLKKLFFEENSIDAILSSSDTEVSKEGKLFAEWFHESTSRNDYAQDLFVKYKDLSLNSHEVLCIAWLIRNKVILDNYSENKKNILLLNYERLVGNKERYFDSLFNFLDIQLEDKYLHEVHGKAVRKSKFPAISEVLKDDCDRMMVSLGEMVG